jgi:hypothetical protein
MQQREFWPKLNYAIFNSATGYGIQNGNGHTKPYLGSDSLDMPHFTLLTILLIFVATVRSQSNQSLLLGTSNSSIPSDVTYLVPVGNIHRSQLILAYPPPAHLRCSYHRTIVPRELSDRVKDPFTNLNIPSYDDMHKFLFSDMHYTAYIPGESIVKVPSTGLQQLITPNILYDYVIMTNGVLRWAHAYQLATKTNHRISGHAMLASNGRIGTQKVAYAGEMKLINKVLTLDNKSGKRKSI